MARDFNGSTDRIDYANVLDAGAGNPCTFSVLTKVDVTDRDQYIICFNQSGDAARGGPVFLFGSYGTGVVEIYIYTDGTSVSRSGGESTIDSWIHWIFTCDGGLIATNQHIYKNNTEISYDGSVNGSGNILDGQGKWSIGGRTQDDNRCFDGKIAELGYWNRVISAGERAILTAGFSPGFIPNGLQFAPDLIRNQRDIISGKMGTLDGTSVYAHPRIIYPSKIWIPHKAGGVVYQELNLVVSADANVAETDTHQMVDTDKSVSADATVSKKDAHQMVETDKEVSADASIACTDLKVLIETDLVVTADALVSESDIQQMADIGKEISADALVSKIDKQQMVETGKAIEAAASISCTDLKVVFELNLEVIALGNVAATDAHTMIETGKFVTTIATPAVIDTHMMVETDLDVSAEANVSCTDMMGLLAHIAAFMILRQCT